MHLENREFGNGNTATKIISAVGKQCQHDSIQPKKSEPLVFQLSGNNNIHSYNKQLVWNRFALHTAGR
jgi:hypothetical protein